MLGNTNHVMYAMLMRLYDKKNFVILRVGSGLTHETIILIRTHKMILLISNILCGIDGKYVPEMCALTR